jgi:hypothetical protein
MIWHVRLFFPDCVHSVESRSRLITCIRLYSLSLSLSSIANRIHETSSGHLPFLLNLLVTKAVQGDFMSSINRSWNVSLK